MLITQLKSKDNIETFVKGKTFIINCHGCKEIYFPEKEAIELQKDLSEGGNVTEIITRDYICNPDNLSFQLKLFKDQIEDADTGCDTCPLPGFQGVTPLEFDCGQCGECYLNYTGGICPITACSKSLVNGQCGGSKNGKCEVDKNMDCGWELIYRKLEKLKRLDTLKFETKVRDYAKPFKDSPDAE